MGRRVLADQRGLHLQDVYGDGRRDDAEGELHDRRDEHAELSRGIDERASTHMRRHATAARGVRLDDGRRRHDESGAFADAGKRSCVSAGLLARGDETKTRIT